MFTTPQGVHSLFVTDYTPSPGSGSGSKTWSASLNDCVVQLEMWDEAAQIAEATMKPGEYYSIKNARMRLNNSGYLEGKVSEGKITQLDENDVESDIHLKALLKSDLSVLLFQQKIDCVYFRRKEEWSLKHNTDIDSFQLIQDAQVGRFFDCVVEVLSLFVYLPSLSDLYEATTRRIKASSHAEVVCHRLQWKVWCSSDLRRRNMVLRPRRPCRQDSVRRRAKKHCPIRYSWYNIIGTKASTETQYCREWDLWDFGRK